MQSFKSLINILNNSDIPPSISCIPFLESKTRISTSTAIGVAVPSHSLMNSHAVTHTADFLEEFLIWFWSGSTRSLLNYFQEWLGSYHRLRDATKQQLACTHSALERVEIMGTGCSTGWLQCWNVVPASLIELWWDRAESTII